MTRTKGSPNKPSKQPSVFTLTTQERIQLLANIIVDRIIADTAPKPPAHSDLAGEGSSNA